MSAPTGRVIAIAETPYLGPIENAFYPAPDPPRRFRLRAPGRLDHLDHKCRVDGCNGQVADDRIDVVCERRFPLCLVLAIAPASLVRRDVAFRAFPKGHPARGL